MNTEIIAKLLETINCAIIILDPDGTIILSNTKAKEIFCPSDKAGYASLEGLHISSIFLPEDHAIFVPNIIRVTKQKGEFEGEALLRDLGGRRFFALLSTSICPLNGREGLVFTVHDITNLKQIEKLLKKSERLAFLGRMLDDISHQIRNPILTIGGFARRLRRSGVAEAHYADVILRECGRLELLLERLNHFLRLPKPRPRPIKLGECMDCLYEPLSKTAEHFSGTLVWECPDVLKDLHVLVDEELIARAVIPVVENAFESYIGKEGSTRQVKLSINTPGEGDWTCKITVSDWGVGIRPNVVPKVFDPFFTTKTGHIGMGLTIAKRIVDELSGEITIDTLLGKGTDVNILLLEDRRRPIRRNNQLNLEEQVN